MQYRKITPDERPAATMLQCQAFHSVYDPGNKRRYETCRAAFDDQGRMTACLELLDYDVWFDGRAVGMGGVGGVVSLPEYRRGGHVRSLFSLIFEEMYERGDVFSYLYPFSHAYYRQFGYEQSCRASLLTLPLEELLPMGQPGYARQFLPGGDPEPIITVYNDFACRYNMMADRNGCQWQSRLEVNPYEKRIFSYVWHHEDGRPIAYFQYEFREEAGKPRTMRVIDIAWRDHAGLLGLLGFMGRLHGNLKQASMTAGPDLVPELLLSEPQRAEHKCVTAGMNRVIHAARALELMRKPAGEDSVLLRVIDPSAPWNDGLWRVEWDRSGSRVSPGAGSPDLGCSAAALSQLVTGYAPLELMAFRKDVEITGDMGKLSALFPVKKIMIAESF